MKYLLYVVLLMLPLLFACEERKQANQTSRGDSDYEYYKSISLPGNIEQFVRYESFRGNAIIVACINPGFFIATAIELDDLNPDIVVSVSVELCESRSPVILAFKTDLLEVKN